MSSTSTTDSTQNVTATETTGITPDGVVSPANQQEDRFIYIVMAAVMGCVVLITLIMVTAFIIKSRRRRRLNLRTYHERQQRPPTVSLDVIDREDYSRETINGVNHVLYGQDSRLPITVFDNQSRQDTTDGTSPTQSGISRTADGNPSGQEDGHSPVNGDIRSAQQDETVDTAISVYENTNISEQNAAHVCKQPKMVDTSNTKDMLQKRTESENQQDETYHDYETAFPVSDDPTKREYENVNVAEITSTTDSSSAAIVKSINDKNEQITDKQHTENTTVNTGEVKSEHAVKNGNVVNPKSSKSKPKIKPKPAKRFVDKSDSEDKPIAQENNTNEFQDYENSPAKVKRTKFQQAKLLKAVPPPCSMNPYINVTDNEPIKSDSEIALQRQSSEYEDSENVLSLQKYSKFKSKPKSKDKDGKLKPKHVLPNIGQSHRSESRTKLIEAKYKTDESKGKETVVKKVALESKHGETKAKQMDQKPEYANIIQQNPTDSITPDSGPFDYENEDTIKELKSTLKRLGKRGFSTSSLETCKQDRILKASFKERKVATSSGTSEENDNEYLAMDAVAKDDSVYLQMDAVNDDVYMPMVAPEEDVYMPMEHNYNFPKSVGSKTLQPSKVRDNNLSKGYLTTPKPCGGVRSTGYVNFSDQPLKYVNFFRSRSTDNVYSYANARSRNFKL